MQTVQTEETQQEAEANSGAALQPKRGAPAFKAGQSGNPAGRAARAIEEPAVEDVGAEREEERSDQAPFETTPDSPDAAAVAAAERRLLEARTAAELDEKLLEAAQVKSEHEVERLATARAEAETAKAKLAELDPDDPAFQPTHAAQLFAQAKIASFETLAQRAAKAATKASTDLAAAKQAVVEATAEVEITKLEMAAAPLRVLLAAAALEAEVVLNNLKAARARVFAAVEIEGIPYQRARQVIAPRAAERTQKLEAVLRESVDVAESLIAGCANWEVTAKQRATAEYARSPTGIAALQAKEEERLDRLWEQRKADALRIGNLNGPDGRPWGNSRLAHRPSSRSVPALPPGLA